MERQTGFFFSSRREQGQVRPLRQVVCCPGKIFKGVASLRTTVIRPTPFKRDRLQPNRCLTTGASSTPWGRPRCCSFSIDNKANVFHISHDICFSSMGQAAKHPIHPPHLCQIFEPIVAPPVQTVCPPLDQMSQSALWFAQNKKILPRAIMSESSAEEDFRDTGLPGLTVPLGGSLMQTATSVGSRPQALPPAGRLGCGQ